MQKHMFNLDRFKSLLDTIEKDPDIISVTLVSRDGLMVSHSMAKQVDERLASPIIAAFTGTGEQLADQFHMRKIRGLTVIGTANSIICVPAGDQFILAAYIKKKGDIKRILTRLRRVASRIRK
ncbi:MAG: roadblock/LC7 domain-containing protein [Candidatus Ranarchaeia archaeon]